MKRRFPGLAMLTLPFLVGCASSSPTPPPPPAPPPPPVQAPAAGSQAGRTLAIAVVGIDAAGKADPDVLELSDYKKNSTIVVWTAPCGATKLAISFKASCEGESKPPGVGDPVCEGAVCAIGAKELSKITKRTTLCYGVTLEMPEKPPVSADPKLIVNP